jgi:hypothetical protein
MVGIAFVVVIMVGVADMGNLKGRKGEKRQVRAVYCR